MPYALVNLKVNRVDLVDEGCNSAAFIELFKRKETNTCMELKEILAKMKPEHAAVVQAALDDKDTQLSKAKEDLGAAEESLAKAKTDLEGLTTEVEVLKAKKTCECDGEADEEGVCKVCGLKKAKSTSFDEEETMKSMPKEAREMFAKMKAQKEAAEAEIKKAKEEKEQADAEAKAEVLKALPIEKSKLVEIVKSASPEVLDVLTSVSAAIDATVLSEVGKSKGDENVATDAWAKIEKAADEVVTRDKVSKQKAISIVIKEKPELYKEYLNGGGK